MDLLTLISPLIRKPEPVPENLAHLTFYSEKNVTQEVIWKIFFHPRINALIQKSCQSTFRKNKIIPLNDLITEACINRIEYITRSKGLPFPSAGLTPNYQWEGWFVITFINTCRSIINKEMKLLHTISLDEMQTEHGITLAQTESGDSPEAVLLSDENEDLVTLLNLNTFLEGSPTFNPQMRLYTMLLNLPKEVTFNHFEQCYSKIKSNSNSFTRSLKDVWTRWIEMRSTYIKTQLTDSEVLTNSRNALVFLLFGERYTSCEDFIEKDKVLFDKYKDRMRKTINRSTYIQHKSRIAYILEHVDITQDPELFLKIIKHDIIHGLVLSKNQRFLLDQCARLLLSYTGENHCHKTIGAILHKTELLLEQRVLAANHKTAKVSKGLSKDFEDSKKIEK